MSDERKIFGTDESERPTPDEARLEALLAQMPKRSCPPRVRQNVLAALREETETEPAAAKPSGASVVDLWFRRRALRFLQAAAAMAVVVVGVKVYLEIRPRLAVEPAERVAISSDVDRIESRALTPQATPRDVVRHKAPQLPKEGRVETALHDKRAEKFDEMDLAKKDEPERRLEIAQRPKGGRAEEYFALRQERDAVRGRLEDRAKTGPAVAPPEVPLEAVPRKADTLAKTDLEELSQKVEERAREAEAPASKPEPSADLAARRTFGRLAEPDRELAAPPKGAVAIEAPETTAVTVANGVVELKSALSPAKADASEPAGPPPLVTLGISAPVDGDADRDRRERFFAAYQATTPSRELERENVAQLRRRARSAREQVAATAGAQYFYYGGDLEWLEVESPAPVQQRILARNQISEIQMQAAEPQALPPADTKTTWALFAGNSVASFGELVDRFGGTVTNAQEIVVMPGSRQAVMVECAVPVSNGSALINTVNQKRLVAVARPARAAGAKATPAPSEERKSRAVARPVEVEAAAAPATAPLWVAKPVPGRPAERAGLGQLTVQRVGERDLAKQRLDAYANFFVQISPPAQAQNLMGRQVARGVQSRTWQFADEVQGVTTGVQLGYALREGAPPPDATVLHFVLEPDQLPIQVFVPTQLQQNR
ncbi:hypothetical protein AMJ85_07070 [candidate division BRC1 bacterium SM23_51]|nr:MAG: hypothetical protein AMJ85_07070 [candidate division BRC1 bacterium SM23_51]